MRHLDYLRRPISPGDRIMLLYPLCTGQVERLVEDGSLVARLADGGRVVIDRPAACTIQAAQRLSGE